MIQKLQDTSLNTQIFLMVPWWPSCLDRGALNNVEAPGCGTSVVRR